jgi:glycosyltransferase involved in cell wall biosynthesis
MGRVKALGLERAVRHFGSKRPEEIVAAIDECDIGVIPNRRSVFTEINTPTRIFEYLSRGKPVIAGRAQGVRDYFDDDALFFFELGDAEGLARVIAHVASHGIETQAVVKRGQQVYLRHKWTDERRLFVTRTAELLAGVRSAR